MRIESGNAFVRRATSADLDAIVGIFLACWRTSYAAVLPARLVDVMTADDARDLWSRALAATSAKAAISADGTATSSDEVLLAVDADTDRPLAVTRWALTDAGEGIVYSLYVDPQAQGRGLGRVLLTTVSERLAARGVETLRLWVFRDNAPARTFYARHGFSPDGVQRVDDRWGEPEIRLMRPVDGPASHPVVSRAAERVLSADPAASWTPPSGAVVGVRTPSGTFAAAAGDRVPAVGERAAAPMTPHTVHDLASVTKAVTTSAIAHLVSDGAVSLDDDVRRYVPTFAHRASVRELLLHRAGLWEWWPLYVPARDREAAHAVVDTLPLRYEPGSGRHYSDLGFILLGRVVESAAGTDLATAVDQLVAAPLGMSTMGFGPRQDDDLAMSSGSDAVERRMLATSDPYPVPFGESDMDRWRDGPVIGEVSDGNAHHALGGVSGHAGLFASVPDLLTFAAAWSTAGPWSPEVASDILAVGPDEGQALGWRAETIDVGGHLVPLRYHPGYTGSTVAFVPGTGIGVVVATNRLVTTGEPVSNEVLRPMVLDAVGELLLEHVTTGGSSSPPTGMPTTTGLPTTDATTTPAPATDHRTGR